jgi:hypothetical protein
MESIEALAFTLSAQDDYGGRKKVLRTPALRLREAR